MGAIVETVHRHKLDAVVCIGGGGTQKNAFRLMEKGLNIVTLPKTIDNDVYGTDVTFGFDTALGIATEAIDRLHSTAHSHHRIIVMETMGHRTGWLALGAGIAGGADVILIPELPFDVEKISEAILRRRYEGKNFSIVAVAEGAMSKENAAALKKVIERRKKAKDQKDKRKLKTELKRIESRYSDNTIDLSRQLDPSLATSNAAGHHRWRIVYWPPAWAPLV